MAVVVVILTLINVLIKELHNIYYVLFFIPLIMIVLCLLLLNGAKMPILVQFSPFFNGLDAAKLRTVIVITLKRLFAI
ncbi:hypothetical protein QE65_003641 [Salmonella enterica subsp. enterica]|nr:hypothetical protein [Salmonella enterica subsp. enterica serovar Ealing]EEJ8685674.1 hypothetical protein [Salmonella enterica subsp. enterica serovar Ealing]